MRSTADRELAGSTMPLSLSSPCVATPDTTRICAARLLWRGSDIQPLVDEQSRDDQDHGARQGAKYLDDRSDLPHLGKNFRLILLHLRFGIVEKDRIVLVHRESALVNQ